ncbi:MAG: hypothetical protein MRECE_2c109 [Mycoplasmataceae bacterium CE_OT135]|nr:MAG: hypothetical protein MRECE_2c109 [Mycoplasmataceae bacterium CE_OT135]
MSGLNPTQLEELKKALWDISAKLVKIENELSKNAKICEELSEIRTILKDWMVYQGAYEKEGKVPNRPVKEIS